MNPKVAAILQALAPALEAAVADAATAVNPLAGAAVAMGEQVLNAAVGIVPSAPVAGAPPVVLTAPAPAPVTAQATVGVTPTVPGIQPVAPAPGTHPLLVDSGRAPLTAQPHPTGTVPTESDMNFPDVYDRVAALEAKVNALVNATGMAGSAAMAAHA